MQTYLENNYVESSFIESSEKAIKPFKTIIGYTQRGPDGDYYGDGRLDHVMMDAGVDRSGNSWSLTKDGYGASYQFQKLETNMNLYKISPDKIFNEK